MVKASDKKVKINIFQQKIEHNFRKQSILKINAIKNVTNKSYSPNLIFTQENYFENGFQH